MQMAFRFSGLFEFLWSNLNCSVSDFIRKTCRGGGNIKLQGLPCEFKVVFLWQCYL